MKKRREHRLNKNEVVRSEKSEEEDTELNFHADNMRTESILAKRMNKREKEKKLNRNSAFF